GIPARARILVDQDALGPVDPGGGRAGAAAVAVGPGDPGLAPQTLHEEVGDEAAAVEALVDDDPVLVDLRVVLLGELLDAVDRGAGHVDISHLPVGRLGDLRAVARHPGRVAQGRFVRDRHHRVAAWLGIAGRRADFDRGLLAGGVD